MWVLGDAMVASARRGRRGIRGSIGHCMAGAAAVYTAVSALGPGPLLVALRQYYQANRTSLLWRPFSRVKPAA